MKITINPYALWAIYAYLLVSNIYLIHYLDKKAPDKLRLLRLPLVLGPLLPGIVFPALDANSAIIFIPPALLATAVTALYAYWFIPRRSVAGR
jgi:hypothetical protein